MTKIVCLYSFQSSSRKSEIRQYKSNSKRVSSNQAWVGNGGQIGRSTMGDTQSRSREANHKNQNQKSKNKEQARIVVGQKQKLVGSLNLLSRCTRNSA